MAGTRRMHASRASGHSTAPNAFFTSSETRAMEHFRQALELTPRAPIARIEFGNGLYLLQGDRRLDEVSELYVAAAATRPLDAMEKLDVEAALAELE